MALIRLTARNLDALKRGLTQQIVGVKSAHLTEALAAGLGFRTHAALRARIANCVLGTEPLAQTADADLTLRLSQLCGLDVAVQSDALHRLAWSGILPDPCWRQFRKGDMAGINGWYRYCAANNLPDLYLTPARVYIDVEWDCISLDPRYEAGIRTRPGKPMVREMFETFQAHVKGAQGKPIFEGSWFVGKMVHLLPDTARALADEFFGRLYEGRALAQPKAA